MRIVTSIVAAGLLVHWTPYAFADFVVTLKNGRRIMVQNYREEGNVLKFYGLGGEVGINKDQILSIRKAGAEDASEARPFRSDPAAPVGIGPGTPEGPSGSQTPPAKPSSPEEQRALEEKQYQQQLKQLTQQLKDVEDRYSEITRGTTSKDPTILSNEEQVKARTDALISRQKDAQQDPGDPGVLKLLTPSPFSSLPPTTTELRPPAPLGPAFSTPPPAYTERQKELSELRNQAIQLEKEKERLINEMKEKKLETGSLFPE